MVTTGDGVAQNPVDVTLSGATAVGYSGTGYKTYWLAYGVQQWGRSTAATLNFSIPFQKFYCITTAQESWSSATFNNTSWITRNNRSMTWPTYNGTNINYIAVGVQQWGTATQNGYATSFPLTFPSCCLAVVATYVLREGSSYWQKPLSLQAITRSSFTTVTASAWGANDTAPWIAVGR